MEKRKVVLLYVATLLAACACLLLLFWGFYDYVNGDDVHRATAIKTAYAVVLVGLGALVFQGIHVFRTLISPLDDDKARLSELTSRIRQMASLDDLTKAYNRSAFDVVLSRELEHLRRGGKEVSAVMFDVDNFRRVNDEHGYHVGDRVLVDLATAVKRSIRGTDTLFRWRGGRFIVLAAHTGTENAAIFADKLRKAVERTEFSGVHITISLGVAGLQASNEPQVFVARLKQALRAAKEHGPSSLKVLDHTG